MRSFEEMFPAINAVHSRIRRERMSIEEAEQMLHSLDDLYMEIYHDIQSHVHHNEPKGKVNWQKEGF